MPNDLEGARNLLKMSSVMPFSFNAVELCFVIINEKPWTHAKETCRALEYGKATKAADAVRRLCSKENYAHKWQLAWFVFQRIHKNAIFTLMRKRCMNWFLRANSQKQKTSGDTAAM